MTPRKETELSARLVALNITPAELAAIITRPVDDVAAWVAGDAEPDPEAKILLRLVIDPARTLAAELAAEYVRSKQTVPLGGEDWQSAEVERPYGGGFTGTTGGRPQ